MKKIGAQGTFESTAKHQKTKVEVNLALFEFEENGVTVIYSPALDLSGYGNTSDEGRESFGVVLDDFFSHLIAKNTLDKELRRLGWKINRKRESYKVKAPDVVKMVQKNEHIQDLFSRDFKVFQQPTFIPE